MMTLAVSCSKRLHNVTQNLVSRCTAYNLIIFQWLAQYFPH